MLNRPPFHRLNGFLASCAAAALAASAFSTAGAQQPTPSAERVRGGMFDASDPAGLARFMEKTGYRVELRADTKGDPVITGRISRSDYVIQFYECEQGLTCNSVQFMSQAAKPATLTGDSANAFNARWRYVRITFDATQVKLQMDVNLDAGVTSDNFEDTLDIWRQLLEIYERDILGLK